MVNSRVATTPLRRRTAAPGDRQHLAQLSIIVLFCVCIGTAVFSLSVGPVAIDGFAVLRNWLGGEGLDAVSRDAIVLFEIRMPRILLGLLVGGALAASGAMLQGLFRNPLADPGLIGVSAGAALAAVTVIVLGDRYFPWLRETLSIFALPTAAIIGGLLTTWALYRIATRHGQTSTATMLLAGIAIAALAGALSGILVYVSTDQQLRDLTFWSLGSLGGATWQKLIAAVPFVLPVFVLFPLIGRGLNAMLLGDSPATHMGVDVQVLKRLTIVSVACAVGASVAVSGVIGFVGIVVPHLLRLIIGPDNRFLIPACILLGGALLLIADNFARTIVTPAELPIGIVTALIGAPFFLWLLLRQKGLIDV
ncbi:MAG: iron ABC transporter permease [Pseudomonadota bacterium]